MTSYFRGPSLHGQQAVKVLDKKSEKEKLFAFTYFFRTWISVASATARGIQLELDEIW